MKHIKELIEDINAAVEWYEDYETDDRAGEDNVPMDCLADAMTLREHEIIKGIKVDLTEHDIDVEHWDKGDWDRLLSDVLHFHIESKTKHMFADVRRDGYIEIDSWPIQELHTQFDIGMEYGRVTEGRIKAAERHIEACISTYSTDTTGAIVSVDLCWPCDDVWMFYADLEGIRERVEDMLDEETA